MHEDDLKNLLETRQTLLNVGLDKLADLARFINEFESRGFSAVEVRELAQLKKELDEEGIRIGTLRQRFKSTRVPKAKASSHSFFTSRVACFVSPCGYNHL
jgi:hypothetical protein